MTTFVTRPFQMGHRLDIGAGERSEVTNRKLCRSYGIDVPMPLAIPLRLMRGDEADCIENGP